LRRWSSARTGSAAIGREIDDSMPAEACAQGGENAVELVARLVHPIRAPGRDGFVERFLRGPMLGRAEGLQNSP
jgi:hypothetical protein